MPIKYAVNNTHMPYIDNPVKINVRQAGFGDVLIFDYMGKTRMGFVLSEDYEKKLHALDLNILDRGDLISVVIPPMSRTADPYAFYHSIPGIRKIILRTDCYRSYFLDKISNIQRVSYDAKPKGKK